MTNEQTRKVKNCLGDGRMDSVTIKLMNTAEVRLSATRSGHTDGYQRMSYGINTSGEKARVVQTAFDN